MSLDVARAVADAVLYEGYLLYPYRASAKKNQVRWQFGVLMPRGYAENGSGETWWSQTECLVEPEGDPTLHLRLRYLQLQARVVEQRDGDEFTEVGSLTVGDREFVSWDEASEREAEATIRLEELLNQEQVVPVNAAEGSEVETIEDASGKQVGRIVRRRRAVSGALRLSARAIEGRFPTIVVRIRTENLTEWNDKAAGRDRALRHSLVAAHLLLKVSDGRFVSLLEPPEWARAAAESCSNVHTFPVLIGEEGSSDVMLSSPIILYDYPQTAPESPGDLYDSTEIDEILTLRTMALTDEEKREARLTDPRASEILDRTDSMPPEVLERLHGAIRYLRSSEPNSAETVEPVPWWDPGADASVSPETDSIRIDGVDVSKGTRVRLSPGSRRADAQDIFLEGRIARVEAVFFDVDDNKHLAVTLEDDPAADLHQWHGRFFYFNPEEVTPLDSAQRSDS